MYDAIVVGAGAAGLAAARILHDAGDNILLLEAQNRIGGRIYTVDTDVTIDDADQRRTIELGAELVHGENCATHNLLNKYGGFVTTPAPRYTNMWWVWKDDGVTASPRCSLSEKARNVLDSLDDAFDEIANDTQFSGRNSVDPNSDCSLATYLRKKGFTKKILHTLIYIWLKHTVQVSNN